ncbi:T9SS type A sorting domain-containing protein [Taibaiella soli]|nr:T9SS type A sorting domain-containing protein [Taibaiella soli]
MQKKLFTLIFLTFLSLSSKATFTPITLTGFNGDAIANGIGAASTSTTVDIDGGNYTFIAQDYQTTANDPTPTYYLPTGGAVNSLLTSGLGFQLAGYSGNNVLRLDGATTATTTATLTFATAQTAGDLYVLCTSGSGTSTATFTVNFTNNTSQTFTGIDVDDWYNGTASVAGIGRINTTNNVPEGNSSDPRLYEVKLSLNSSNYANQISSITVSKTSTGGEVLVVLAVSKNDVCSGTPTAGSIVANPATVCSGKSSLLTLSGTSSSAGLTYQWQSYNGTAWNNITSATDNNYTTDPLTAQGIYRCTVTCVASTLSSTTNPDTVNISAAMTPPYLETFESIQNDEDLPDCMSATNMGNYVHTFTSPNGHNSGNHTPNGSKYGAFQWSCQDTMYTPALNLTAGQIYKVSFWYNTDGLTGWNTLGAAIGASPNSTAMTIPIGTAISSPANTTYQQYTGTFTPTTSGVYFVGIYCGATSNPWYISIDDISVVPYSPCTGTPTAGVILGDTSICMGDSTELSLSGATTASSLTYQWQTYNGTTWVNVTTGYNATTDIYTTIPLSSDVQYRCSVTCSGNTAYTAPVTVHAGPSNIPYTEDFESIQNDDDMPNCMSSTSTGTEVLTYTTSTGSYNQDNHTPGGNKFASFKWSCSDYLFTKGLNLIGGQTYKLSFWYITDGNAGWNTLSAAFGTTASAAGMTGTIGTAISNPTNTTYQQFIGTFTPTTSGVYYLGIYCDATSNPWYLSIDDINVIVSPCNGTPTAGTAAASVAGGCAGTNFTLNLTGNSTGLGISAQWQSAPAASGPWTNLANGTTTTDSVTGIAATTYYRAYVACSGSGLGDTSNVVTVNQYPLAYTATVSGAACAGTNVTLNTSNPTTGATYSWSGPNSFTANTASATINNATLADNGAYTLTTSINGCTGSESVTVTVNPKPVITAAGTNPTSCGGNDGTLTISGLDANAAYTVAYDLNSSTTTANITSTNTGDYTFTGTNAGTYDNIIATSVAGCTSDPANQVVITNPIAMPDPTASSNGPVCAGADLELDAASTLSGVTYHWSGPNGFISTMQNPTIPGATATASGTYTVYTTYQSCTSNTVSVNAVVNDKPDANVYTSGSTTICQGTTVTLSVATVTGGNTYQWQNNGTDIAAANGATYDASADGHYRVIVESPFGCSDTSVATQVTVESAPTSTITYSGSLTICQGNSVVLDGSAGNGYSYQWYKDGNPVYGATSISYTATTGGYYTLIVTASGGCNAVSAGVTVVITVPTTPIISMNGTELSTTGFASYQWYKDGNPIPGATNATLTVTTNGYYTVAGTDAGGCTNMSAIAQVSTLSVGNLTVNGNDVNIYPNPASTTVHIDASAKLDIQIRNLEGQTIMTKKAASDIDISGIANGVYMISLTDKDGNLIKIDRLVIVH